MKAKKVEIKIHNVCDDCGIMANTLTCLVKYCRPPTKVKFDVSTYVKGICDCCKKEKFITQTRDFYHPDFELLNKFRFILKKSETEARKRLTGNR